MRKPALKIVKTARTTNHPPRTLGKVGLGLWTRITNEYDVNDAAGKELLALGCEALDRAEACRAAIDRDGEVQRGGNGFSKEHPALSQDWQAAPLWPRCCCAWAWTSNLFALVQGDRPARNGHRGMRNEHEEEEAATPAPRPNIARGRVGFPADQKAGKAMCVRQRE